MDVSEPISRRLTRVAHVPRDLLTDSIQSGLSLCARAVRLAAFIWAKSDTAQTVSGAPSPDVGWLVAETRQPFGAETLAILTGWSEADVTGALTELLETKAFVRSDAGVLGVAGWWPEAARRSALAVRKHRARRAAA